MQGIALSACDIDINAPEEETPVAEPAPSGGSLDGISDSDLPTVSESFQVDNLPPSGALVINNDDAFFRSSKALTN